MAQSVIGARITHNKVKNNGALADQSAGSVGIMLYNGSDIIAEYNEVSGQTNASGNDADGFNLAGGCIRCIIQYNYSHDNKGAGYLIDGQANGTRAAQNAIVRFNISENDARGTATRAGIYVYNNGTVASQLQDWYIHNNTVYMSPGSNRSNPAACIVVGDSLQPSGGPLSGGKIFNNICYVSSGAVVMVDCKSNAINTVFANNLFYSASGTAPVLWNKCTNSGNIIGSNPLLSAAGSMGEVSSIAPLSVATRANYQISTPEQSCVQCRTGSDWLFMICRGRRTIFTETLFQSQERRLILEHTNFSSDIRVKNLASSIQPKARATCRPAC